MSGTQSPCLLVPSIPELLSKTILSPKPSNISAFSPKSGLHFSAMAVVQTLLEKSRPELGGGEGEKGETLKSSPPYPHSQGLSLPCPSFRILLNLRAQGQGTERGQEMQGKG